MIGAFIVFFLGAVFVLLTIGLIFHITLYSIKYDTEDKKLNITASIIMIVFIIGSVLFLLGI